MLSSIYLKTIYQKRWSMLGWGIGILAMVVFVMVFFPTISKSGMFDQTTAQIPDSLKSLVGDLNKYKEVGYYIQQQVFIQMPFLTIVFAAILCSSLIAGEEGSGTLQTLLTQPVSRSRVYVHKLLAGLTLIGVASLLVFMGIIIGLGLVNESVSGVRLLEACFNLFVISSFVGVLTYMVGAITGRRGLSGAIAGLVAFASYIVSTIAVGVTSLQGIDKLSPFHYYITTNVIDSGLNIKHIAVLVVLSAAAVVMGWFVFIRRDIIER